MKIIQGWRSDPERKLTDPLPEQIFAAAAANDIAIFSAAEAHKAAMEASANPAAYDFSAGWPAMFEAQA
jgi:hypothetical protein